MQREHLGSRLGFILLSAGWGRIKACVICGIAILLLSVPCLKAGYFGAFHLFFLDRRQPICIKDRAKIPRNLLALRAKILKSADFFSIKEKTQPMLSHWRVF